MSEIPIPGVACSQIDAGQSPSGAGVIAPAFPPKTADAGLRPIPTASDYLAAIEATAPNAAWPREWLVRLVELWLAGLSTVQIGIRLGRSKNSIVGKAHRLGLPARPSPIPDRWTGPRAPRRVVARPKVTLAPLASEMPPPSPAPLAVDYQMLAEVGELLPPPPRALAPVVRRTLHSCCWPIGDPGTKGFSFCGDIAPMGKPYCGHHAAIAYVKIRPREAS